MTPAERLRAAAEKIRDLAAEHIWSPPVALAVADLLDAQARYVDDVAMMFGEADHETDAGALALADLILGAES